MDKREKEEDEMALVFDLLDPLLSPGEILKLHRRANKVDHPTLYHFSLGQASKESINLRVGEENQRIHDLILEMNLESFFGIGSVIVSLLVPLVELVEKKGQEGWPLKGEIEEICRELTSPLVVKRLEEIKRLEGSISDQDISERQSFERKVAFERSSLQKNQVTLIEKLKRAILFSKESRELHELLQNLLTLLQFEEGRAYRALDFLSKSLNLPLIEMEAEKPY